MLDSKIDYKHSELIKNYDLSIDYDLSSDTEDLVFTYASGLSRHGTEVAGVIAADDNDSLSVGIAPDVSLASLAIDYGSDKTVAQILKGFAIAAERLDVVNSSWSFLQPFGDNFEKKPELAAALTTAASVGRGGLGTVLVFSAGNTGNSQSSNYHSFQNSPFSIAVGAVDATGAAPGWTSLGANVLVCAPGKDVYTTDPNQRMVEASGTSFAAPVVSGVAALMLEANSALGYRDIQQILALTARKAPLDADPEHGSGWTVNGAGILNGGGLHFSDAFGYGFVNAHDAVRLAETWTLQQTAANRATASYAVETGSMALVAGKTDHLRLGIDVTEDMLLEHVQLILDLDWKKVGDLEIFLTSPAGQVSQLVYDFASNVGSLRNFPFTSIASLGEAAAGHWTIDIHNRNPLAANKDGTSLTGRLREVTLRLHGRDEGLTDDTYVYTDELSLLYASKADRLRLADGDGGIDTLNAAAVTSDSRIDLSVATATIAGQRLSVAGIENVVGGDGDDVLTGNAADNWLRGMRGDDVFHVSGGADRIAGGAGLDTAILGIRLDAAKGQVEGESLVIGACTFTRVEVFEFLDRTLTQDEFLGIIGTEPGGREPPKIGGGLVLGRWMDTSPEMAVTARGTEAADTIRASGGIDGLGGDDALVGRGGDDLLRGGAGADRLAGQSGDDWLEGGTGADTLQGGGGDDTLQGGAGSDMLKGQVGADVFYLGAAAPGEIETIGDFDFAEGDRIVLGELGLDLGALMLVHEDRQSVLQGERASGKVDLAIFLGPDLQGMLLADLAASNILLL